MDLTQLFALLLMLRSPSKVAGQTPIRLVDGSSPLEGRVEIYYDNQWGTICDDHWEITDALVVCRQLFSSTASEAKQRAYFGRGSGPIWLDDISCEGNETGLAQCYHRGWSTHNCAHSEDAGVICNPTTVRLVGGSSLYEGRVEVYHSGHWEQYATMAGASLMHPSFADSWDMARQIHRLAVQISVKVPELSGLMTLVVPDRKMISSLALRRDGEPTTVITAKTLVSFAWDRHFLVHLFQRLHMA
eukprot:m.264173 g.264173  ORF g.264173 m.264173 type:complete len:245 (+) comp40467_c1_seq5:552-1286(+)